MKSDDLNKFKKYGTILIVWLIALVVFLSSLVLFQKLCPATIHFICVENGDACLIRAGQGGNVLIDGGDINSGTLLEDFFNLHNIRYLDAVIVSHFHQDHVAGILELLENDFPISRIYIPGHPCRNEFEKTLLRLAEKKNVPVTRLNNSDKLTLGKATYQVISQESYKSEEKFNNMSLILRMDYYDSSFLFTGDIEKDASARLVSKKYAFLDVDVLKVPHHGGSSSANQDLVLASSPDYSIITSGTEHQNKNPADITIAQLLASNSKIYRTDRDGTITMILGKKGIRNISYNK